MPSIDDLIMYTGFILAAYSVVWNDVIQTLGTFLTSNAKRPWWVLWGYIASILVIVLVFGWWYYQGDVSYGRLGAIPYPETIHWWYILPPLVLLMVTYFGFPVSTTFMILSVFSSQQVIEKMVLKSVAGYGVSFIVAFLFYLVIAKKFESKSSVDQVKPNKMKWVVAQWLSTGFLWAQWLIQDFANLYVYLPRTLNWQMMLISLILTLILLGLVISNQGGRIQDIVRKKANTANIRSATLIDFTYGIVLFFFTTVNPIPMSTTWTFVGILAGREYAISYLISKEKMKDTHKNVFKDLAKINAGLAISIILAILIRALKG